MNGGDTMFPQRLNGGRVRASYLANDNVLANDFAPMCTVEQFDYIEGYFAWPKGEGRAANERAPRQKESRPGLSPLYP